MKIIIFLSLFLSLIFANGWNKLHNAVLNKNIKEVEKLLKRISIESQTNTGITPLIIAIKNKDVKMIKFLIEKGADIDMQDNNGVSPLHYAIGNKMTKIANFLIVNEADIDIQNNFGITPLHQASFSGQFNVIELLLISEANPNIKNNNGDTAYDIAMEKKRVGIAKYLESFMKVKK